MFLAHPDRFTLGTDTFTPERWHFVVEHAAFSRRWLGDLPRDVADGKLRSMVAAAKILRAEYGEKA